MIVYVCIFTDGLGKQELCGCDDGLVKQGYYCGDDFANGLGRLVQFLVYGLVKQGSQCIRFLILLLNQFGRFSLKQN